MASVSASRTNASTLVCAALLVLPCCNKHDADEAKGATESDYPKFSFDASDFRMSIRYYGPDAERFYKATFASPNRGHLLASLARQPKHLTAIATERDILNWRSQMHGPWWEKRDGVFEPDASYVGYVVEVETAGRDMYFPLGWGLETFDALESMGVYSLANPRVLDPMLDRLKNLRKTWIARRYSVLLDPEWKKIIVGVGTGSCWGEGMSPVLVLLRKEDGAVVGGSPEATDLGRKMMPSTELPYFQKKLYEYVTHFAEHGECTWNSWTVISVSMQRSDDTEPKEAFYGYGSPDEKTLEFQKWIKGLSGTVPALPMRHPRKKGENTTGTPPLSCSPHEAGRVQNNWNMPVWQGGA